MKASDNRITIWFKKPNATVFHRRPQPVPHPHRRRRRLSQKTETTLLASESWVSSHQLPLLRYPTPSLHQLSSSELVIQAPGSVEQNENWFDVLCAATALTDDKCVRTNAFINDKFVAGLEEHEQDICVSVFASFRFASLR